ncbi:hypothetical protein HYV85_01075 [Candidatus Woesearchaeota archaeon]|nr:hypothetical protein [Candidatus Woesearchaeota archaeon]
MLEKLIRFRMQFLLIAVVAGILISGCAQLGGKRDKGSDLPEFYTGTEGLVVGFAPESVPSIVTAGSSLDVVLLIANKGAADVPAAIVLVRDTKGAFTLEGAKGSDKIAFSKPVIITALPGKESSQSTSGALEGVTLTLKAREFVQKIESLDSGLLATACYKHKTKLTSNVCIDASGYSFQKQRKPCDANVPIVLKSQGAPVAVKKIETLTEKSGGYVKPKFKIYIGNVGNGLIIDKGSLNLFCTNQDPQEDIRNKINVVAIDKVELNNEELLCSERSKVLSGNIANDFVLCAYPDGAKQKFEDGSGTFATPLKVELSYGYTSTSNPVPIRVEKGIQCEEGAVRSCSITGGGGGTQKCIDGHWTYCQK